MPTASSRFHHHVHTSIFQCPLNPLSLTTFHHPFYHPSPTHLFFVPPCACSLCAWLPSILPMLSHKTHSPLNPYLELNTPHALPVLPLFIPIIYSRPHNLSITKKQETDCKDLFFGPNSVWGWIVFHIREQHQHFFAHRCRVAEITTRIERILEEMDSVSKLVKLNECLRA